MKTRLRAALSALFAVVALATAVAGQVPATVQNLAPAAREGGWVSFTVPRGTLPATDGGFELDPFGWPVFAGDLVGTQARLVHVRTGRLQAFEKIRGSIVAAGDRPAEGDVEPLAAPPAGPGGGNPIPELEIAVGEGSRTWRPASLEVVERGPARTVFHGFGRVPGTPLVANLWLYVYTASRVVPFELFLANSDPRTTELVFAWKRIGLRAIKGVFPAVDYLRARGGRGAVDEGATDFVELQGEGWAGDGQGLAFSGRLIFWRQARADELESLRAATEAPLAGMALNWQDRWGPWGEIPDLQKTERTEARGFGLAAAHDLARRFADDLGNVGNVFRNRLSRYGLNDRTAQTGDAQGFGVTKLAPALAPRDGNPFHLYELAPSVFRDAARPSFFYEADGTPLDLAKHPQWVTWNLQTHYHPGRSRDRLGKIAWAKDPKNVLSAKDFAHLNSCIGAGWTILTGSHFGRHLSRAEITAMVPFAELLGETRAAGRLPLGATWNYLATGDRRVLELFAPRVWKELVDVYDRVLSVPGIGPVRPLVYAYHLDGRHFGGKKPFWLPWQEALAIAGLDALSRIAPDPKGEAALLELCRSYIAWGWARLESRGNRWWTFWDVELRFRREGEKWIPTGEPLTLTEYQSPDNAAPGGGGIYVWAWGAVRVARRRLAASSVPGDDVLAKRCDEILEELRAARAAKKPLPWRPIGFDRDSEWKATR